MSESAIADIESKLNALKEYDSWRENLATKGPDLSVAAYALHLRQLRHAENLMRVHRIAVGTIDNHTIAGEAFRALGEIAALSDVIPSPEYETPTDINLQFPRTEY